jgi:hypothetical protein
MQRKENCTTCFNSNTKDIKIKMLVDKFKKMTAIYKHTYIQYRDEASFQRSLVQGRSMHADETPL